MTARRVILAPRLRPPKAGARKASGSQSLERGLDILEMIAAEGADVGVRELARRSGLSPTIVQRLISSLANPERAKKLAMEMAELTATLDKPILLSTYTTATPASIAAVAAAGIPCYTSMPSCARAIKALVDYSRFRERLARRARTRRWRRRRKLAARWR